MLELKLADLACMTETERERALDAFAQAAIAPRNGQVDHLNARISAFEAKHGMSSAKMLDEFRARRINDTPDVSTWLMLLRVRGDSEQARA